MNSIIFPDEIMEEKFLKLLKKDFSLYYDGEEFQCSKALSSLISIKIQTEMLSDVFLSEFPLPKYSGPGNPAPLSEFLSGKHLIYDAQDGIFLYMIASILQISYLETKLSVDIENALHEIELEQIIDQANYLFLNRGNTKYHESVLASYFPQKVSQTDSSDSDSDSDDDLDLLKQLPIQLLDSIFTKQKQKIDFDDPQIIGFIISMGGRLLRHLNLNKLKHKQLSDLLIDSKTTNLNYLRNNICDFLLKQKVEAKSPKQKRFAFLGNSFSGIINYLYEKNKANPASVSKSNLVTLTGSPNIAGSYQINNIFDFQSQRSSYKTKPNEEMKFTIDFKNPVIQIDGYTIRTLPVSYGTLQPTTWKISVSIDGNQWELIDEQNGINFETFQDNTKTFLLLRKTHKVRFVTFYHPPIKNDKYGLCISSFELFGVYTDL